MKYREAFAIGSKCEGIIKCTFARLYDETGRALFSLQRRDAVEHLVLDGNSQTGELYAIGRETDKSTIDMWIPGVVSDYEGFETKGEINFDLPLVWIDEISDDRLVPAHFTDKAIEILTDSLSKAKHPEAPIYQKLISIINSGEPIYIKPDAFEWYATDITNVTVETTDPNGKAVTINLDEAIAAAKKKMDDAKRALLLVGVTNVI